MGSSLRRTAPGPRSGAPISKALAARSPGVPPPGSWPNGSFDPHDRDGVNFSFAGSARVSRWLVPQLLARLPS
jgi:hypothetical protein